MLSCKQASQLLSQSLDRRLSLKERMNLRFHLLICDVCKRFGYQLDMMRKAVRQMTRQLESDEQIKLPEDAKKRISQAIESNRH